MIPLHHAFGVKGPCQHQVIGLVNDAAAVVHRDGFDDFGFAFGVAFNLDTNWGQDVFGGSPANQELELAVLRNNFCLSICFLPLARKCQTALPSS